MKWMLTGFLGVLCACGGQAAEPAAPAVSSGAEAVAPAPPPPLPAPRKATLTQPVHVPLQLVAASIQAQLPEHQSQPRALLTRPGASPAIEASIDVWRDDVQVRFDEASGSLQVDVVLRYAAKFDARLKNPFGGKWLTVARDADWGTAEDPQRVTLHLRTHVDISPQWQLQLRTEVDAPEHGPAPAGELCTSGFFKLCVTKESFAPEVRRRIESEIVPRVREELEKVDRKIEETVQLRARAERLWSELSAPRALGAHDRYRVLQPEQAALELRGADNELVVEAAVHGQLTYHQGQPPPSAASALPDRVSLASLPGEREPDEQLLPLGALF